MIGGMSRASTVGLGVIRGVATAVRFVATQSAIELNTSVVAGERRFGVPFIVVLCGGSGPSYHGACLVSSGGWMVSPRVGTSGGVRVVR